MTYSVFTVSLAGLALILAAGDASAAGDAKAGRKKALQCQACHGIDGASKLPDAPNLSGQIEIYLVKAMQDYRSGARKNEVMSVVAQQLSDQDILDLAAWYAAIPITVTMP
jgi:cytochrome c553